MNQERNNVISFNITVKDTARLFKTRYDDRLRKLVMRSGLPGSIGLFSDNPEDVESAKFQLVRSFASPDRKLLNA